jgi:Carboxypeptidase regulatory-like domain
MRTGLALLVALLVIPLETWAATPMTKLTVHVTTQGGHPIDGADVVVRFVKGRSVKKLGKQVRTTWEMRTSQEGEAKVPEIPQGTIRIQVIAKGYQTFGDNFDVDQEEKTVDIKLNPPQPQYSAH